ELLCDEPTQWDSTYIMLNLSQAIDCYLTTQTSLSKHGLSLMEWMVLQDLEVILEVPHTCQQSMSSENTPMLSGAVSALEHLM
ncbi:uncharacterized protein BJ212DRAFT_1227105, partial [Suillus subaureus]